MLSRISRFSTRSAIIAQAALLARPTPIPRRALPVLWSRDYSKKRRPGRPNIPPEQPNQSPPTPPSKDPVPGASAPASESREPAAEKNEAPDDFAETIPEKEILLDQLPDLTKGIPSTLEYETAARKHNALATTEQPDRPKGTLPDSAYISSSERRRQKFANRMYLTFAVTSIIGIIYLGREWETEAEVKRYQDAPNGWSFGAWWARVKTRSTDWLTYYQEPAFEKLLPDPDPSFQRPYTLVLSLEDLLIKSEWTREHGWRIAKRPGVDYFIHYLSQYYELVLFTSVPFAIGEPAVRKLDPFRFIMWPLFREATKYVDGEFVKDLSYLNRDLSKVIIIDTNPKHVSAQPENAIVLPKWNGHPKDQDLVALIPFLEYIHTMQFPDVRKVLKSFEGKHIPTEFARREAIARAQFNKELAESRKSTAHGASGFGLLGSLLGLNPSNMNMMQMPKGEENPQEAFAKGKMLQDIAREQGQRNYEMMEQQIKENGEKWLKEEQEVMEKMQKEAMSSMQQSFLGMFSLGGGQTPKKD